MDKRILLLALAVIFLVSLLPAHALSQPEVRDVLMNVLLDAFLHPNQLSDANVAKIDDLIAFYSTLPPGAPYVDLSGAGAHSGKSLADIITSYANKYDVAVSPVTTTTAATTMATTTTLPIVTNTNPGATTTTLPIVTVTTSTTTTTAKPVQLPCSPAAVNTSFAGCHAALAHADLANQVSPSSHYACQNPGEQCYFCADGYLWDGSACVQAVTLSVSPSAGPYYAGDSVTLTAHANPAFGPVEKYVFYIINTDRSIYIHNTTTSDTLAFRVPTDPYAIGPHIVYATVYYTSGSASGSAQSNLTIGFRPQTSDRLRIAVGKIDYQRLFTAKAYYDPDGPGPLPEQDVTSEATWSSFSHDYGTWIDTGAPSAGDGLFYAGTTAPTIISATYKGITVSWFYDGKKIFNQTPESIYSVKIDPETIPSHSWGDNTRSLSYDAGVFDVLFSETIQLQAADRSTANGGSLTGLATWSSSDPGVLQSEGGGRFLARRLGSAIVTASYNGGYDDIAVTVVPSPLPKPPANLVNCTAGQMIGDLNNDGVINNEDYLLMYPMVDYISAFENVSAAYEASGMTPPSLGVSTCCLDVNGDGVINGSDTRFESRIIGHENYIFTSYNTGHPGTHYVEPQGPYNAYYYYYDPAYSPGYCGVTLCSSGILGDANGDGVVDSKDQEIITAVARRVVATPSNICCMDLNQNGIVDIHDIPLVLTAKGTCAADYKPQTGCTWTQWLDSDSRNGMGDYETLSNIRNVYGSSFCPNVKNIECMSVDGFDYSEEPMTSASTTNGCVCRNDPLSRSATPTCKEYSVRLCCGN